MACGGESRRVMRDILLAGAAQGFMLCVVVLSLHSANRVANRLLAAFIGLESLHLFLHYFILTFHAASPIVMCFVFNMRVLAGPALYLYACAITEHSFQPRPRLFMHLWVLLPTLAMNLFMFIDNGFYSYRFDRAQPPSWLFTAMSTYHSLVIIAYAAAALRQLSRHRYRLEQALSAVDGVNLNWLRLMVISLIAVQGMHIGLNALTLADVISTLHPARSLNTLMIILMVYLISLGGLRQPKVFTAAVCEALAGVDHRRDCAAAVESHRKYVRSGLTDSRRLEIWAQLQNLFKTTSVYLDTELNLASLARRLNISPQELSETINTEYHGTFYELVNFHRIEAAKALLQQSDASRRKMLDVALSVGFNSLSTFYNQFKKFTRITPTEYRERNRQAVL
jgi:AraC-like DNA-binding protein